MSTHRAIYVLNSHWDREWYQPFQDYRYRLVRLIDRLIDGWESGTLKGPFQTDGQTILLEDYLEIRPQRRPMIARLLAEGKLAAGPWYVLPDEFLVSGESLVRNLQLGIRMVRELGGEPSRAGFVCDLFGHTGQLPQIFAGFEISFVFLWRGLNCIERRLLRWRGADGTELPAYRFGMHGYVGYAAMVRDALNPYGVRDSEAITRRLNAYLESEAAACGDAPMLLFDGGDHQEWDAAAYAVLAKRFGGSVAHGTLDDYIEAVLPHTRQLPLLVEGELRAPASLPGDVDQQGLLAGVLSSRVDLKQANAGCQTLLCHWAEPLAAMERVLLGTSDAPAYLDVAWRWLIQNHPHDSICGCSVDRVHEDMRYRFSQCEQIGERLSMEASRRIAAAVAGNIAEGQVRVVLFNSLPVDLDETIEMTLDVPVDWPTMTEIWRGQSLPQFRLRDDNGQEVPYQRLSQDVNRSRVRIRPTHMPERYQVHEVHIAFHARVPAMGYATYVLERGKNGEPIRYGGSGLATGERSMSNEFLDVRIETDGTLTVRDRRNGRTYSHLLALEDTADVGDGWNYGPVVGDQAILTGSAQVSRLHDGPRMTTFGIRTVLSVPAAFDFARMERTEKRVELVVEHRVTLRAGADRVEMETRVHNTAEDHRLRVLFPSGAAAAKTYLADGAFDVVERPIALRPDNTAMRELELETKPQQTWTAVADGGGGLAVISTGLMESAVRDLPDRPIALTLLRATRRVIYTDGQPGGQLLKPLTFRYWIVPLQGEVDRSRLCVLGQRLAAGVRAVQLSAEDMSIARERTPALPPCWSMLRLEGPAVLTCARPLDDQIELRFFNPGPAAADAAMRLPAGVHTLHPVHLDGRPAGKSIDVKKDAVTISQRPKVIQTLRFDIP